MTTRIDRGIGRRGALAVVLAAWIGPLAAGRANPADADAGPAAPVAALGANPARRAVAAVTPTLPAEVVAQLQGGRFAEAMAALDPLIASPQASPTDRAFFRLVQGGAARLGNRPDDARTTWTAAIEADPTGVWVNKLRGELAALELATGHPDRAEVLARIEAQALLDPDRKDRLAEVYRDFARRLLEPEFPGASDDPVAAYALLARGRDLAKSPALRAALLFAMGRAGQEAAGRAPDPNLSRTDPIPERRPPGPAPDPIRDYNDYLREYPQGADRDQVRFHRGEVLLRLGRAAEARLAWTDLARDLAGRPDLEQGKLRRALRGLALYEIARTYGMPTPGDQSSLNLGVASLRRFLREAPADPKAPLAAFEIGQAYLNQGQADPAIAALGSFLKGEGFQVETDEARRTRADLAMRATFLIAQAKLGQGRFPEAIAAFEAYLNQYPNGSEAGNARRAILDAQFATAQAALAVEQFAAARAGWLRFAEVNPLDGRVPSALFLVGEMFARERKWDDAIAAWDTLAVRFAGSEEAAHGQFEAAALVETEKGDPAAAIERFRKVGGHPAWGARANQRIATMEANALTVITPRVFRSGETAQLKITTRNLARLTFAAYKLNPESYFREKHSLGGVAALDISLVAPDSEWTVPVPGYARYKPVEANFDLKVALPGVYVVKVSDDKTLQASALVIGSDLEAIVKVSRSQILVFAQDMRTGQGREGVRVLVADDANLVYEATTGDDGVVQGSWNDRAVARDGPTILRATDPSTETLRYLVLDGGDAAGSGLSVPDQVARGLSPRAYIDTDRPAYRPGQEVAIRGVVREARDGQYANPAGAAYKLEVSDSQGRVLVTKEVTLSPFGTFRDAISIDSGAPVGTYRIRLWQPGGSEFTGGFEIQAYQLARLGLEFDLPRTVFYRGETVKVTLQARYGYDAPAAGRPIAVRLPDGQTIRGQTDAQGRFLVEFPTDSYGEDQTLTLQAQLPADNVAARAMVRVAVQGFGISLATPRSVYLDGETFTLTATTLDALGQPTGRDLRVAVIKPIRQAGGIVEREVGSRTFRTDQATGRGQVTLQVEEAASSSVILRVAGTDQFRNPVVADTTVTVAGRNDEEPLRILADRTSFKVGESATVRLMNRAKAGTALIAWEADRILRYQLLPVPTGETSLPWVVDGPQFPNFTLTASRMVDQRFDQARLDVQVERDLRITLAPRATSVAPGAEVEVEVAAVDQLGRPAQAELALALVDRTLLRQYADKLPPIGPFFYDQTRLGAFATTATNTFTDHPGTEPVPDAVVEEADRQLALDRSKADLASAKQAANLAFAEPRRAPIVVGTAAGGQRSFTDNLGAPLTPRPAGQDATPDAGSSAMGGGGFGGQGGFRGAKGKAAAKSEGVLRELSDVDRAIVLDDAGDTGTPMTMGRSGFLKIKRRGELASAPRQSFVETAYWNPAVVTGPDGKATIKFRAPEALSEYRLMAKGVTGATSLVGQTSTNLVVRKNFFVELRTPARLTEGDQPRFVARVHHVGVAAGTVVQVRLASYAGDQDRIEPKTVEIQGDGVTEVIFYPVTIPDAESIRLTVAARAGDLADEVVVEVPIRPWGVQALATAAGTASTNTTAFVGLPGGRRYDDAALEIQLAPTLDRLVVELALGQGLPLDRAPETGRGLARYAITSPPIPIQTTADRAADLLAAVAGLTYLRDVQSTTLGEATRLRDRARGLVANLVATQNQDGGWAWVTPWAGRGAAASDRQAASIVAWALREAARAGIDVDSTVLARAGDYLGAEFNRTGGDLVARAAVLHTLAVLDRATFEQANSLNRSRTNLPDVALAHLALTLGLLDRPSLAGEVLDLLATRARSEPVGPGQEPQTYWEGKNQGPWSRGRTDTTALVALAMARVRPGSPEFEPSVAWLLAHRVGSGWHPHKARGAAVAAIAAAQGKAHAATDRYRLAVAVNGVEVGRVEVVGETENRVIPVPRQVLKLGAPNAIQFTIEGRGTFGYAATLTAFARDFGPEQRREGKIVTVEGRDYLPGAPELDGRVLPTGFGSAINPTLFTNKVTQVARGGRVQVEVTLDQRFWPGQAAADRNFHLVEETLPAGTTLVAGSVQTSASSFTERDGVLSFAFPPDSGTPTLRYELAGYLPGDYRALPTVIRNLYDPGTVHLGPVGALKVLAPGERATDPYRATPDELVARGQALAAAGRIAEAAVPLEELFGGYTPTDAIARDAARILLTAHIQSYDARKVVRDFEILKDKGPEVIIPFDEVLVVGRAYRDIGEFERAFLVYRALAEASYLEDAQVGAVLRRNGQTLEAITFLLDLWRDSPGSAAIEGDLFGLSQVLTDAAGRSLADPALRAKLGQAEVSRPQLLAQSIHLIQTTLALNPRTPLADEASLALLGNELDLENFEAVTRLAPRFAALYPKSPFLDSFQYADALSRFQLGQYDQAIEVADRIARATYPDPNGVAQPSPNKWQALYILGQIHDARRQPALAVGFYQQVADRFADAADAVLALSRQSLKLPEVTILRPPVPPQPGNAGRLDPAPARSADRLVLSYRNVGAVDLKVYPVDLMRLYLTRRNLDGIAGIDLAGITPLHEATIPLGPALTYADATRTLDLPIQGKEGAYLVMVRGGDLYASGIVLVSPIELEVTEEPAARRVRVVVRDAASQNFVPKVQVKVIGSQNPGFTDGRTDLRGVAVAEGISGQVTAVARVGTSQYAFYRGTAASHSYLVNPFTKPHSGGTETLEQNLRSLNLQNQNRGLERLQNRFNEGRKGIQAQEAK